MRTQSKTASFGTPPAAHDSTEQGNSHTVSGTATLSNRERKKRQDAAIDRWATVSGCSSKVTTALKNAVNPPRRLGIFTPAKATAFKLKVNLFESLPPEIGEIPDLLELNLSFNCLRSLPLEISKLSTLRRLDLSSNKFTSIPAGVLALPQNCDIDFRYNPLPEHEILAMRALVSQRSDARRPLPRLRLPSIAADKGTLREAAEKKHDNVFEPIIYETFLERLVGLVSEHARQTNGREISETALCKVTMDAFWEGIVEIKQQGAAGKKYAEQAVEGLEIVESDNSFTGGFDEGGAFFEGFDDPSGFDCSSKSVLQYVMFDLDAQILRTPQAYRAEAKRNAITLLIDALAEQDQDCKAGRCEALMQMTGLPLSRYAQTHPEVIGKATIRHTPQQIHDLIYAIAKEELESKLRRPWMHPALKNERLPLPGLRDDVARSVYHRHEWITTESFNKTMQEIESEWPTFLSLVRAQSAQANSCR